MSVLTPELNNPKGEAEADENDDDVKGNGDENGDIIGLTTKDENGRGCFEGGRVGIFGAVRYFEGSVPRLRRIRGLKWS